MENIDLFKGEVKIDEIVRLLWKKKKLYLKPTIIVGLISILYSISIPRYYTVKITLAPEYSSSATSSLSSVGGLASVVGLKLPNMTSTDAITPSFYPDVMESTNFLVPLLKAKVKTQKDSFEGTYESYLKTQQKTPWWGKMIGFVRSLFSDHQEIKHKEIDPYSLSKKENELIQAVSDNIKCTVDKKTDIITLSTTAQDPLVATLLADTVKEHLQNFIIEYRTKKARTDLEHIDSLCNQTKITYEKALKDYALFMDSHRDLFLSKYEIKRQTLESEYQMASSAYSLLMQQRYATEAKVQERTPVFTTIKNSTVPVRHAGPKRMLIVLTSVFITFILTSVYIVTQKRAD